MQEIKTALGRWVPGHEAQTVLEDSILRLLYDYQMSPQNPHNAPMKLSDVARAVVSQESLVVAALDSLTEVQPPFVEVGERVHLERTVALTQAGARFVRSLSSDRVLAE